MSATTQPKQTGPSPLLYSILVTFLSPLFLGASARNNDFEIARAAAIGMLQSFNIRTDWDLMVAVQIVCFGVAALGSLGLSMDDELPVNTVLRCRYNANALQRSADRGRDRLEKREAQVLEANPHDFAPLDEEAVLTSMRTAAQARHAAAEARARFTGEPVPEMPLMRELREGTGGAATFATPTAPAATPTQAVSAQAVSAQVIPMQAIPTQAPSIQAPSIQAISPQHTTTHAAASAPAPAAPDATPIAVQPAPATPANPARVDTAVHHASHPASAVSRAEMASKLVWAGSMATVATELAEEMPHLSPDEQRKHQIRIDALCSVSKELAAGGGKSRSEAFSPLPFRTSPPA
jgi:hypothetical protein